MTREQQQRPPDLAAQVDGLLISGNWQLFPSWAWRHSIAPLSVDSRDEQDDRRFDQATKAVEQKDIQSAIVLFEQLAREGDQRAAACLGGAFEYLGSIDDNNYRQAEYWYREVLKANQSQMAELGLARIYYYGFGRSIDYRMAEEHLRKAQPESRPDAALMLGWLLARQQRQGGSDVALAKYYYEIAANADYPWAMVALARFYGQSGHWLKALRLAVKAARLIVKLRNTNENDPRLLGFHQEQ